MTTELQVDLKTETSAIEILSDFIATVPAKHKTEALLRSRRAVLDTIGCMLVGVDEPVARNAISTVSQWGEGNATVVGADICLPSPWAALVNGSAAKAFDYDDWEDPSLTHTTATLLPGILALPTAKTATGSELFDAHIIGVETIIRIGEAINPGHYAKGWHSTSTIGAIGATAACSRVLKLDHERTACALSIATSMTGGLTAQFGTMIKPMHAGLAAKAGVLAATLAANGITARRDALDGKSSFASTTSDATRADFKQSFAKLGKPWAILEHGLHVKLYPSCGGTHRVIECALELRKTHNLKTEDIEAIEINVADYVYELLHYGLPKTIPEALFSFPYCLAVAFCRGRVGLDEFHPHSISDAQVCELAKRVIISTRPAPDRSKLFLKGDPDVVTVKTRSGAEFSHSVDVPHGAPPRFADNNTVERKFFDCASRKLSEEHAIRIRDLIFQSESDWLVSDLRQLLRVVTSIDSKPS